MNKPIEPEPYPVVNGIRTEEGYRGYDAWYWGTADAVLEALVSYSIKGVARLVGRLAHFVEYRHIPDDCRVTYANGRTRKADYCAWWVEDVDKGVDKLNAVTSPGYVWHLEDGGLYLSPDCGEYPDSPNVCSRVDCVHNLRD